MKISEIVKELNKAKRKFGDLEVSFDITMGNEDIDPANCLTELIPIGVCKTWSETSTRSKKQFIFGNDYESAFEEKDILK
jgi:hypothetical protein